VKIPKLALLATSSFRLALAYSVVFACVSILLLGTVYLAVAGIVDRETSNLIEAEVQGLREQYLQLSHEDFIALIRERSEQQDVRGAVYLLVDPAGQAVAGNIPNWPAVVAASGTWMQFTLTVAFGEDTREHQIRARQFVLPGGYRMLVGHDVQERDDLKRLMLSGLFFAVFLTLLLGVGGGILMGRRILREARAMSAASQQIMSGDLSRRLPVRNTNDELNTLAREINAMLEKIEQLSLAMRTVLDSAAHDLRTPLNRLQRTAEAALGAGADSSQSQAALEQVSVEVDSMRATLDALLRIVLAETGTVEREPVDLSALVTSVAELYEPLAEEHGLSWVNTVASGIVVRGNRQLLAQAVANLADNAVKFSSPGGRIEVVLRAAANGPEITVQDTGIGIPADRRAEVLGRRVRLEETRHLPGSGLGLSLVAAVSKLHNARLVLEDAEPGLRVRMIFQASES
jgi:signal transduction histidine kinase